jgi:signal transduction histidine kinase
MKYTLRTKLSLSYIFITLLIVALISLLVNVLLEKQFNNYIIKEQESRNQQTVQMLSQQYTDGSWNQNAVENIGINALEQGMIVKLKNASGSSIWDATVHNQGLCLQMIDHMSQNMLSHYPNFKGGYTEKSYPVQQGSVLIGQVEIGYYGPFYFTDNDLAFLTTLNKLLLGVALLALLIAFGLGAIMSKRISSPILQTINAAQRIAQGNFKAKIDEKSTTAEINQLIESVNSLADHLDKQESLRKRMSADVAHELRTPLATLQSHLEAMLDGIWEADQARLKSCHEEVLRINKLVGDLEKLARYESENLVLEKTEFDVTALTESILLNFEMEALKKNIHLDLSGVAQKIYADKDKISQLIINLVANALKFTPQGGSIQVLIASATHDIKLTVKDTGQGIHPDDLPYVFERFYRADKSRNRITGGSGIGLAISKAIVEAHKGSISVESQVDVGTTFTVLLPRS